jgi:hypothetical protein
VSAVETQLIKALRDTLSAVAAVTVLLGDPMRIAQASGDRLAFPFLRFGEIETMPNDSASAAGWVHQLTLEITTRADRDEALAALHAVRSALHAARPVMADFAMSILTVDAATLSRGDDPLTWRALVRLRAFTEPK